MRVKIKPKKRGLKKIIYIPNFFKKEGVLFSELDKCLNKVYIERG